MNHAAVAVDAFSRRNGSLFCEEVELLEIARTWGTPSYVYSRRGIEENLQRFERALAGVKADIRYAVKANPAAGILQLVAARGHGADTVSAGEIARALRAGIPSEKIVFSGVGKTADEIRYALRMGIGCFNVESAAELERLAALAKEAEVIARFSIRCNPDVDAQTHPYISTGLKQNKFGIPIETAEALYLRAAKDPHLKAVGIDAHIGSQLLDAAPHTLAAEKLIELMQRLSRDGIALEHIDIGGGYGIAYEPTDCAPEVSTFLCPVVEKLAQAGFTDTAIMVEPGRSIVGTAGVLLTEVQYLKDNGTRRFAVVDAGMNDLIRPALYSAWMGIEPLVERAGAECTVLDVVGPVCESSDFLGKERALAVTAGDVLAVRDAGAYGASMASRYNSRALPVELLVDGSHVHVLRARERFEDIVAGDQLLDTSVLSP